MIKTGPFVQTLPPHIRSTDSLRKRYWLKSAALFPVLVTAMIMGGIDFLRILTLGVMSVVGFDWLGAGFFKRKLEFSTGDTFFTGLIFVLLLPEGCPSALIILGAFIITIIINDCFGGLGSRLFNAALFGRAFLDLCFPVAMTESFVFQNAGNFWMLGAIVFSVILFLVQRQIYFEALLFFTGIFLTTLTLLGSSAGFFPVAGIGLFAACFFLSDNTTLPMTRRGTWIFAVMAAFLAGLFSIGGPAAAAMACAILVMNGIGPWIDHWLKTGTIRMAR